MAAGFAVTLGTAKLSQWTTADTPWNGGRTKGQTKGYLLTLHKSTAVLLTAAIVPRVALPGGKIENLAADVSHGLLYGPPPRPDKTKEDGAFAGKMFGWHTMM